MNSHSQQPGHHGAKSIKQVAIEEIQEVDEERGNGEDQRELLILSTAVCDRETKKKKQKKNAVQIRPHLMRASP